MIEEKDVASKDLFARLLAVNVNDYVEEKNTGKATLKYLSWSYAWKEVRARYPSATYKVIKNENNLPYFYDPNAGIMVYTEVTIDGETHEMWLHVMDGANNALKFEDYEVETKYGTKKINKATMADINKTIMRCLAKNLAMFGLGLYIYAGEDLPDDNIDQKIYKEETEAKIKEECFAVISEVDSLVKNKVKDMKKEEKIKFANEVIIPIIGDANYKACKDIEKLTQLRDKMSAA